MIKTKVTSGGSRGAKDDRLGPNFFIFMQFSRKIIQIVCWRPLSGVGAPTLWEILDPPLVTDGIFKLSQINASVISDYPILVNSLNFCSI